MDDRCNDLRVGYTNFFALTFGLNVPEHTHTNMARFGWARSSISSRHAYFFRRRRQSVILNERLCIRAYKLRAWSRAHRSALVTFGESYVDFGPLSCSRRSSARRFLRAPLSRLRHSLAFQLIPSAIVCSILIFNANKIEASNIKISGRDCDDALGCPVVSTFCLGERFELGLSAA